MTPVFSTMHSEDPVPRRRPGARAALSVAAVLVAVLAVAWPASGQVGGGQSAAPSVLVLHSYNEATPWQRDVQAGLDAALAERGVPLDIYYETLDAGRFESVVGGDVLAAYLAGKFADRPLDLLVAVDGPAGWFLDRNTHLFPGIPRLFVSPSRETAARLSQQGDNTVITLVQEDVVASFRAMVDVTGAREIYAVGETATPMVERLVDTIRQADAGDPEFNVTYLLDLPIDELLQRTRSLPADSAIFYLLIFRDGDGNTFVPREIAQRLAAAAAVPVFSHWVTLLGTGIVGGYMLSGEAVGRTAVEDILQILATGSAADHPVGSNANLKHIYDWRALDRFGISTDRLPPDSVILNRPPSVWTEFRGYAVGTTVVISLLVVVASLLTGIVFVVARSRRRLGEAQDRLERNEREVRGILDNLADTFYRADTDGRIVLASRSSASLVGYPPDEVVGLKVADFYADPAQRQLFLDELSAGGGAVQGFEAEIIDREGNRKWVSTSARFWKDDSGNVLGVEGTIRDITERRKMERELRRAQRMEALGQLTGGVAHEFNNVLMVIQGCMDMIQIHAGNDDELKNYAELGIRGTTRAADLTRKLLNYSRREPPTREDCDFNELIASMRGAIAHALGDDIAIEINQCDRPCVTSINRADAENVMLNLAINAGDAMPGGGRLTIRSGCVTLCEDEVLSRSGDLDAGEYIVVSVADTGNGMTPQTAARAFDPFFTTKDVGEGTGLGLSMVYGFARQSRGHAVLESRQGVGTTVRIYLPLASSAAMLAPAAGRPAVA